MCFHLRNMSRISHNMSMTHTQPDVLPIQPIMSMIILQLIYYIIVIVYHTIMILYLVNHVFIISIIFTNYGCKMV